MLAAVPDAPSRLSLLLAAGNVLLASGVVQLCNGIDGLPDEFLLAKAVDETLASMAAQHSPALPVSTLAPDPMDGTPYQQASCALRRFMTAAQPDGVDGTGPAL